MILCTTFLNESDHIKNLKLITRAMDFGIPNIEIFLYKNKIWCTVGIIKIWCNLRINIQLC